MDTLVAAAVPPAWTFKSDAVADNFGEHVRSQLPWYDLVAQHAADLATNFLPSGGVLYDIGASTGNITSLMGETLTAKQARAISIEPSHQMARRWAGSGDLHVIDAEQVNYTRRPPDVAVLFLVLMFMKPAERSAFLGDLMSATNPGGALLIVDKGTMESPLIQAACKSAHLAMKARAGTSADAYVSKELSLRGEQRQTSARAILDMGRSHGFEGERFFSLGEFYGLVLVKSSL